MKASQVAIELDKAVLAEVERLKLRDVPELEALGRALAKGGTCSQVEIDGKSHEIFCWSEPVAHDSDGLFVVLAGTRQKRLIGSSHHLHGFVVGRDHTFSDLAPSALWQYD